jgi:hypothetical protein
MKSEDGQWRRKSNTNEILRDRVTGCHRVCTSRTKTVYVCMMKPMVITHSSLYSGTGMA